MSNDNNKEINYFEENSRIKLSTPSQKNSLPQSSTTQRQRQTWTPQKLNTNTNINTNTNTNININTNKDIYFLGNVQEEIDLGDYYLSKKGKNSDRKRKTLSKKFNNSDKFIKTVDDISYPSNDLYTPLSVNKSQKHSYSTRPVEKKSTAFNINQAIHQMYRNERRLPDTRITFFKQRELSKDQELSSILQNSQLMTLTDIKKLNSLEHIPSLNSTARSQKQNDYQFRQTFDNFVHKFNIPPHKQSYKNIVQLANIQSYNTEIKLKRNQLVTSKLINNSDSQQQI